MEMHWGMRFGGVRSGFGPGRWFDICPYPDTNPDAFCLTQKHLNLCKGELLCVR